MTEKEIKLEKIIPVPLPLEIIAWLKTKVTKIKEQHPGVRIGVGSIARAIIIHAYKSEVLDEFNENTEKKHSKWIQELSDKKMRVSNERRSFTSSTYNQWGIDV